MFGSFDSFLFIFNRDREEVPRLTDFLDDFGVNIPEPGQGGDGGESTAEPVFETSLPIEPELATVDTASVDFFMF